MKHHAGNIGVFPIFCALILAVGLMNHVLVIPPLLEAAQRDAWLSIVSVTLPYILWSGILYIIMKRTGQSPIIPWFKLHYGRTAAWILRAFFFVYLFMIAAITVKETITWTKISYLNYTPVYFLALTLILVCFFAARWGMKAIAIGSGILLPFVVLFGDFVMTANLPKKNYMLLTPILENGWDPLIKGAIYIGGGLAELVLILLVQHHFKSRIRLWALWILALFLVALVFGPVTGAIAEFGPFEAADMRYPAYEEWRLVRIGKYIQHVDFLSIYQWLSGAVIRIALSIYLILELFPAATGRIRSFALSAICLAMILIACLPISDMHYLTFMKTIYFPWSLLSVIVLSLGILLLVLFAKPKTALRLDGNRE